jgi:hypothetical protein
MYYDANLLINMLCILKCLRNVADPLHIYVDIHYNNQFDDVMYRLLCPNQWSNPEQ